MYKRESWEEIKELGAGGQSTVFLVRSPQRVADRESCLATIRTALDGDRRADLAMAIVDYAREDRVSELGALKVFKVRGSDGASPEERIKREMIQTETKSGW